MEIIGTVISGIAVIVAIISLSRLYTKDGKDNTKGLAIIEAKIDVMGGNVKDTRDDVKALGVRQQDMGERLAKVEDSTATAQHRIDGLEEQIK